MRHFRSSFSLLLCIAVFASLFSGFAASAAPSKQLQIPCRGKLAAFTVEKFSQQGPEAICCILLDKLKPSVRGKTQIGVNPVDPCAPVVDTTCGISYPAGSVVGAIPFDQPAFYAPGLLAPGVTINAGTYWVTGLGEAANGDKFYQIVVACQFLFVRENDVVPSYQAPWSGQPLPTTPPVES